MKHYFMKNRECEANIIFASVQLKVRILILKVIQ